MTVLPVVAHVGHWAVSLIYAAPALLLAGALVVSTVRQRRRDRTRTNPPRPPGRSS